MKKLFFFAMLAVGMTAACQKPTVEVVDSDEPVAIQFGMNAPTVSVTKTKAPVDTWAQTNDIHVVAYNFNTDELLWVKSGRPNTAALTATIDFQEPLYYDVNYAYDFRAYYLGDGKDATASPTLTVPFTITGEEDIMAGVTNRTSDKGAASVQDYQMYSAYAARRNVQPSLTFYHMLTRLNVNIQYPDDRDPSQNALHFELQDLTVNTKTTGTLSLAGPTPSVVFSGDATAQPITTDGTNGTIMIEPGLSEITFSYTLVAGNGETQDSDITLKASSIIKDGVNANASTFEAQSQYNVTIKVYDLKAIEVSATLTEWGDGGNVQYDPDSDGWTPDGYEAN